MDFLIRCKTYDVVPRFMRFKLYRKCLHNSEFYKECLSKLMKREIAFKKRRKEMLILQVNELKSRLKQSVSFVDFYVLQNAINVNVAKYSNSILEVHKRKLSNLG